MFDLGRRLSRAVLYAVLLVAFAALARDVSPELAQVPASAVAAPFMNVQWVVNQTVIDAGNRLYHQPWPPNIQLPLNVSITRYVLPTPWRLLFASAMPIIINNPTGETALYVNVYITLDTESLISQGRMRGDCADVLATTEWGDPRPTTVTDCNFSYSRVWFMIPVVPPGVWRIWLHSGCPNCRFADPYSTFLYYENMQRPPRGILAGSATYHNVYRLVVLTTDANQIGYLVYRIPPMRPSALYVNTIFSTASCRPESVWVGVWDTDYVGTQEDVVNGGYHLTLDYAQYRFCFTKSTTTNGPGIACGSLSIIYNSMTMEGYIWFNGTATLASVGVWQGGFFTRFEGVDLQPQTNVINGRGVLVFGGRTTSSSCLTYLTSFFVAHYTPAISASAGSPVSPPPALAPPRIGLVTYTVYINSTHALLNGSASPGVLAAPFTYTIHAPVSSLSIRANNMLFCMLAASSAGATAAGCQINGVLSGGSGVASYYDASAWNTLFLNITSIAFMQQTVSLGFSGMWTPGDSYNGWISVWRWGGVWLNVTLLGGHGVAAPGFRVSATAGTYAVAYDADRSICILYLNGTAYSFATCNAPSATPTLLVPVRSPGIRMAIRSAWISTGTAAVPTESVMYVDFRFSPPISSLGAPPNSLPVIKQGGSPGALMPVVLTGAARTANALWGPFGEICPGRLPNGTLVAFGVRYAWQSPSASPSCSVPLQTAPPAGTLSSTLLPNSTGPLLLDFTNPPVQHPLLVNSVPVTGWFCSANATHFTLPYLQLVRASAPTTVVGDRFACVSNYVIPGGYAVQAARGWALIAPVMRVFRINTTSVVYMGSGSAVLAWNATVPALSARQTKDGRTWHIYTTSGGRAVAATALQTPPNVSRTGGVVSAIFGVPQSPTTLISQWWADGAKYYISTAGLADAPVVYISSYVGTTIAVSASLDAPPGYDYYVGVLGNQIYVWAVQVPNPTYFTINVPTAGYYTVRLYVEQTKMWEKQAYLSPDSKLTIGPIQLPVLTPAVPISLITPVAPKPPVFVPAVTMEVPPYAVGILLLGVFAAAYVTVREVSLASLITGAVVAVLGVLINAPIYGVAGVFLLAFGLWNKARRQGSA
jgi:hypothetical protein